MSVKPILLNNDEIRGILEQKNHTLTVRATIRRPIEPQPSEAYDVLGWDDKEGAFEFACGSIGGGICLDWTDPVKPPFRWGDVLWVRESADFPREAARIYLHVTDIHPRRRNGNLWIWLIEVELCDAAGQPFADNGAGQYADNPTLAPGA